jgi:hypothetical protein
MGDFRTFMAEPFPRVQFQRHFSVLKRFLVRKHWLAAWNAGLAHQNH